MSEERAKKFRTGDVSQPRSGGSADWSCWLFGNLLQPIRNTSQIWVATRRQWRREMLAVFFGLFNC